MTIDEAENIKTVVENKDYIVKLVNTVVKTMIEAFENLNIEDVNMFQLGYNKAIDDFKSRLEERILAGKMIDEKFAYIDNCDIDEIAEQLKAGDSNGT